jgi:hypothetical protein
MPSWQDNYVSALKERDKKEKANAAVYEICMEVINTVPIFLLNRIRYEAC